jgi:flagellar biosynthetic protein FlhB
MEGKDGRTERATPKRRHEERKKGNVCISHEVVTIAVLLLAFIGLRWSVPYDGTLLSGAWVELMRMPVGANEVWDAQKVQTWFVKGTIFMIPLMGPVALLTLAGSVVANMAQTGPFFSAEALRCRYTFLNPVNGLRQMFSVMSLFNMGLAFLKVLLIVGTLYLLLRDKVPLLVSLTWLSPELFGGWLLRLLFKVAMVVTCLFVVVAAFDYAFQKYKYEQSIMMTKKEVEDEHRNQETPPVVKGAQRRKMRELTLSRMMAAVPTATVVVTNPTHVAVALEYDPENMSAPKVTAKGLRLVAERIKRIARENDVPVIERPELARGLYKHVKVGREIPFTLFGAVAEVLAYLYKLGNNRVYDKIRTASAEVSIAG